MKTFKLLKRYLKKNWVLLASCIVLIIFLNLIRSTIPKLTGVFVAIVSKTSLEDSELPSIFLGLYNNTTSIQGQLLTTGILISLIALVREFINIISDVQVYKLSENIGCQAQIDYFKKVCDLPYSYLNHAETGDLIQRSTLDINRIKEFLSGSMIELFTSLCKLIIYGTCMLLISVEFSLYVFIFIPIFFISSYFYFKTQAKDWDLIEQNEGKLSTVLQENLTGIRVVKAFANEEYEISKFNKAMNGYTKAWARTTNRMSLFWGISDILTYAQLLLVFVLSIYFVTSKGLGFDKVVTLFLYTEQIAWPIRNLGRTLAEFGKTSISSQRILDVIEQDDEYAIDGNTTPEIKGNIEFKNVSFQFKDASIPTLKNINLEIKEGETIAIIGKTGSGKSTFVNLLDRLIDPTSGNIYLDGNDITTISKKWLRHHVGIILQEPFLFSRSIEENINISLPHDDINKAKDLARLACVDKDIESFSEQYNTLVGERGVTLSGGQKQRISIARALAEHKEILIFDDSLSAVDTETDLKIREALKQREHLSTMLIITHRISTAKDADKIIVFEDGSITEMGTHQELITKDGLYKTIYDIQNYFNEKEGE